MNINTETINYKKNSDPNGLHLTDMEDGGYHFHPEDVQGKKIKGRPHKFVDFFTQAKMFYNSLEPVEQKHLIQAFQFELSKVKKEHVRQNVVNMFANVNQDMADQIADYLGLKAKKSEPIQNQGQGGEEEFEYKEKSVEKSPSLSMEDTPKSVKTMKLAVLVTKDSDVKEIMDIVEEMKKEDVVVEWVGEKLGKLNKDIEIKETLYTTYPVLYDAILVSSMKGIMDKNVHLLDAFIEETYNHFKPILVYKDGHKNLKEKHKDEPGVMDINSSKDGLKVMEKMRFWDRNIAK